MTNPNTLLNRILDEEFLGTLAKSADLYKIGSNSVLDPQEIRIGLKVVPRAVMSMLISELAPMEINSHKDIKLPFGKNAYIHVNKNAADDYTGSIYDDNKLVYDYQNRSIPGLGIILLSTFELYDLEDLNKSPKISNPVPPSEDVDRKIQKLIDERMELHSLVGKVVENKMAEREAIHRLMMAKLNEALHKQTMSEPAYRATRSNISAPTVPISKPINIEASDIAKKEAPIRKGSPLKEFKASVDRKKNKPKTYSVEILKSETVSCNDCGQDIFNGKSGYSGCICFGENANSKISLKKTEKDGILISFSRGWTAENIEMLLETLRKKNR